MLKKSITIAMAFVGIVIGAGFATGQEVLQYFVAFGTMGIIGAALAGLIMALTGMASIQLGSYFLANDHVRSSPVFLTLLLPVSSIFRCLLRCLLQAW